MCNTKKLWLKDLAFKVVSLSQLCHSKYRQLPHSIYWEVNMCSALCSEWPGQQTLGRVTAWQACKTRISETTNFLKWDTASKDKSDNYRKANLNIFWQTHIASLQRRNVKTSADNVQWDILGRGNRQCYVFIEWAFI